MPLNTVEKIEDNEDIECEPKKKNTVSVNKFELLLTKIIQQWSMLILIVYSSSCGSNFNILELYSGLSLK